MLSGYLQDYDGGGAPAIALLDVSRHWDELCLAFAEVGPDGRVEVPDRVLSGGRESLQDAIRVCKSRGQSVSLSIGGAHASFAVPTGAGAENFVESIIELCDGLGIDGLDFNLEGGVDLSTMTARRAMVALVLDIAKRRSLRMTFTPEWPSIQGGWTRLSEAQGNQLWIVDALRDVLSCLRVQYFNNRPIETPFDRAGVKTPMADAIVAGSRMLLEGFPFADPRFGWFRGLSPRQIGVAVPAAPAAASLGYLATSIFEGTLERLRALLGTPVGALEIAVWSINWDVQCGQTFSDALVRARSPSVDASK